MAITIHLAEKSQKPLINDMVQDYAEELLRYIEIPRNTEGRFDYPDLDVYWRESNDYVPFLIHENEQIAGFAFVNRCFNLVDPGAWSVEEFFVKPDYRRRGIGREAAGLILRRFPGNWEVAVIAANEPALAFWDGVIRQYVVGDIILKDFSEGDLEFSVFTFDVLAKADPSTSTDIPPSSP